MTINTFHIPATPLTAHAEKGKIFPLHATSAEVPLPDEPGEAKLELDIYETESDLIFLAPMVGVEVKNITVTLTEDILTIAGHSEFPRKIFTEEHHQFLGECSWGKFSRSIVLPAAVNSENAVAQFTNGILIITVPKAKKAKSKVVPVQVI
jgi:HSP20 family protein